MRKSAFIEGLLGLALLVAVNLLFFSGNPGFLGVIVHPYLVVVLLIATRYGVGGGAWTGLLAAGTMLVMVRLGQPDLLPGQLLTLQHLMTPALFLATGVLFGEIREGQKRREADTAAELAALRRKAEDLAARYEALGSAKEEIDSRVVSQEHTLSTLYVAAQGLKSLEEREVYPAVLGLLETFLAVESSSVYLLEDGALKLQSAQDAGEALHRPQVIAAGGGLIGQAISRKETVALNRYVASGEADAAGGPQPAIVAPLVGESGDVQGLLKIERLPFMKFNLNTIRMTSLIADWCSAAVVNARTYRDSEGRNISDRETGVYRYHYFQTRFREEFSRAKRYQLPLSLLVLDLVDYGTIGEEEREAFLPVFTGLVRKHVRNVDLLFHDETGARYYLVLTNTPLGGAEVALRKITREIDAFKFRPYPGRERPLEIRAGAAQLGDETESDGDLVRVAEGRMHGT